MNALEVSHDTYPDQKLEGAIREAINGCNRRVTSGDILSYLFDGLLSNKKYSTISKTERMLLSTRIKEKMKGYPVENKNHKYTTWIVK